MTSTTVTVSTVGVEEELTRNCRTLAAAITPEVHPEIDAEAFDCADARRGGLVPEISVGVPSDELAVQTSHTMTPEALA